MAEYRYGTYGVLGDTVAKSATQAQTTVVYVGTAPVNLIRGGVDHTNKPLLLTNLLDAQQKVGYSNDWETFTLCEAIKEHFDNPLGNVGPVVVINVLDIAKHRGASKTMELIFTNKVAYIGDDKIILDSLALDGLVEGTDYMVEYDYDRSRVVITALGSTPATVEASYDTVTDALVTDVIGGLSSDGVYSGISAIQQVFPMLNCIPNILLAPGWSDKPEVYKELVKASQNINGQWSAFVLADIPIADGQTEIKTIADAIIWKNSNGYTSEFSKVCWPMVADNMGMAYHLSTKCARTMLDVDYDHDGIPFETPGNKTIDASRLYLDAEMINQGYDRVTANTLCAEGITTAVAWGGKWKLWGDHTAAYSFEGDTDKRAVYDLSIRMLMHVTNSFQLEWSSSIDAPFTRQLADRILNREQEKLDALVSVGALAGTPTIDFVSTADDEISSGHFEWAIETTPTQPVKSATVKVSYTDAGFSVAYGEESD